MRSNVSIWIVSMIVAMGFALPALLASPEGSAEEGVGWEKGEKWAFGTEEDFSYIFDELFEEIQAEIDEEAEGFVSYEYEREGNVGFYYQSEVVDDSEGLYKVTTTAAFYFHVFFGSTLDFSDLPVEGNHSNVKESEPEDGTPSWENVNTKPLSLKAEAGVDFVVKVTQTNYFTQEDLDIEKMEISLESGVEFLILAKNFPEVTYGEELDYDEETETTTYEWMDVKYHDFDWRGKIAADLNLDLDFEPAINYLDLPIEEGEIWNGTTDITISGDLGGVIDLKEPKGVPQEVLDEFYQNITEVFVEADIDKTVNKWGDFFPLHVPSDWMPIEDLDENLTVENNRFVLKETTIEDQDYSFTTGENRTVTLPGGDTITVYEIVEYEEDEDRRSRNEEEEMEDEETEIPVKPTVFVSPDDGKPMKMEVEGEILEEAGIELEAEPVAPEVAEQALAIKADPAEPKKGGTNDGRTFALYQPDDTDPEEDEVGFVPAFTWGATTAAAAVACFVFRRRRR